MAKISNIQLYQALLKKVFDNKQNEFIMYNNKVIYMSVHIYPMILRKKIINNKIEYLVESMFVTRV